MEHELYNKTDKQLLKSNKVDLVAYIRTLEGLLTEQRNKDTDTMQCTDQTGPQHLTSYTFSDTVTKKDMYSF
nr:MAG TPA: hypothetical protein [Caudoviricetes sp.]